MTNLNQSVVCSYCHVTDVSQSERAEQIGIEAVSCMRSCSNGALVLLLDYLLGFTLEIYFTDNLGSIMLH